MQGGPQIPNVMGGYLEKGAKAVIDLKDELRSQALKLFSGFPYGTPEAAPTEEEKPAAKPKAAPRKAKGRK